MKKINDGLTNDQRHYAKHKDNPEYIARKALAQKKLYDSGHKLEYTNRNRSVINANAAKSRAKKRNQTPEMNAGEWAEIGGLYMYNAIMPSVWHVDHIDPIDNGGLHHPSNLQILSKT